MAGSGGHRHLNKQMHCDSGTEIGKVDNFIAKTM